VRILDLDGDEDRVVAVARLADSGEREEAGPDEGAAGQ
jgi:DNA gyrase subunit A